MPLPPVITSLLEKAATDNGFDQVLQPEDDWLSFSSSQCTLRIWLSTSGGEVYHAALSKQNVALALNEYGATSSVVLPDAAQGGRSVGGIPALHRLLRRAFQLGRTLPDELLHTFEEATASLPRITEAERLVVQRVGQDIFRRGLLDYWEGRCAITGLDVPELLRASHIKPWAACVTDSERLDVYNGLLLAPHFDAVFDAGLVTVADDGVLVLSPFLKPSACHALGLDVPLRVRELASSHFKYLLWHRTSHFRRSASV